MAISVFDIFKIGIGPSSSHMVGPMRAAMTFATTLEQTGILEKVDKITVELFGSLGATGKGHGSDKAVMLGLEGEAPDLIDPSIIPARLEHIRQTGQIQLLKRWSVRFEEKAHLLFHRKVWLKHNKMI
ncbi:MAG: serine dehydratase beta chain [Methylococcales bacterium]|nr:serine dehydratase beta chain [Methylococcales bacterium]